MNLEESASHLSICFRNTLKITEVVDGDLAQTLELSLDTEEELMNNTEPRTYTKGHLFTKQIIIEYLFSARHGKQICLRGGEKIDNILPNKYLITDSCVQCLKVVSK